MDVELGALKLIQRLLRKRMGEALVKRRDEKEKSRLEAAKSPSLRETVSELVDGKDGSDGQG